METAESIISKARAKLVMDHPFFGCLAMNVESKVGTFPGVPTAATDGRTVWFDETWTAKLTHREAVFLVAHECMHPMFDHLTRRDGRDPKLWNIAGDVVINHLLIEEGLGDMIKGGVDEPELYKEGGGITERIYQLMKDNPNKVPQGLDGGCPLGGMDDLIEGDGALTEADKSELEAMWKVRVSQAAQAARMQGKLSSGMERFVGEILSPKVDWTSVLRDFVTKAKTEDRTWSRPNRRWISQGLYMPSITGEAMGALAVAIDTSGSIGAAELDQFAAELRTIQEDMNPETLHVIYFDHSVCGTQDFTPDEAVYLMPKGGGGTAFSPIFRHVEGAGVEPVACVVLTDLYCDDFGPPPEYPVLWVTNGATDAPWGQVVEM